MHLTPQEMELLQSPATAFEEKKHTIIKQKNLPYYLTAGDLIRCEIKSADGRINLGVLENKVVSS
jgi:hypothetical protein